MNCSKNTIFLTEFNLKKINLIMISKINILILIFVSPRKKKGAQAYAYTEHIGFFYKVDLFTIMSSYDILIGDTIQHETLGLGVVVKLDGSLIDVAFKTGIRKLMKNHKKLF